MRESISAGATIEPERSGPVGENLLRLDDFFGRTRKTVDVFSTPAGDLNLDGFQAAVLHPKAELLGDFPGTVLLLTIVQAQASVRDALIAMLNAVYFGRNLACPRLAGMVALRSLPPRHCASVPQVDTVALRPCLSA